MPPACLDGKRAESPLPARHPPAEAKRPDACSWSIGHESGNRFQGIRCTIKSFYGTPFGGYKNSGVGREEGIDELLTYTEVKSVHVFLPDRPAKN